jgi:NADPH:quinone reductase
MRAAYYERKGEAAQVLHVGTLPDPEPSVGEVRVRVRASAVNPSDTKGRSGFGGDDQMPYPRIVPHQDGAGEIDRVGLGVPASRVGERVWVFEAQRGRPFGTAADYVVVPSEQAVALPAGASFEAGASLGIPGMTAHRCLFMDGGIQGETVLVAGGAGAVGHAAVQLARWAGARVIATVSRPEQADLMKAASVDLVLDRKRDDVARRVLDFTDGEGVHRVVEVDFEANLELDRAVLRTNGVIATYASGQAASAPRIPVRSFMFHGVTVHFVLVYSMPKEAHAAAARDVLAAVRTGHYRPHIGRRFPLERVVEAHEAQESGEVVGKIVVDVS